MVTVRRVTTIHPLTAGVGTLLSVHRLLDLEHKEKHVSRNIVIIRNFYLSGGKSQKDKRWLVYPSIGNASVPVGYLFVVTHPLWQRDPPRYVRDRFNDVPEGRKCR